MRSILKLSAIFLFMVLFTTSINCKKDDKEESSNIPEIVGCNSVKYQGYTFTNLGCEPGIASLDVSISQNGHSADFHIICSGGCVSTVTVN